MSESITVAAWDRHRRRSHSLATYAVGPTEAKVLAREEVAPEERDARNEALKRSGVRIGATYRASGVVWAIDQAGCSVWRQGEGVKLERQHSELKLPLRTISTADVVRVISFYAEDDYGHRGVQLELRDGQRPVVVEEHDAAAELDPTYGRMNLEIDGGWITYLGRELATGLDVPHHDQLTGPAEDRATLLAQAILDELDAPDDPNKEALEMQRDRERSAILEEGLIRDGKAPKPRPQFVGPARTIDEMQFAAQLESCPHCGTGSIEFASYRRAQGSSWTLSGACLRCKSQREFTYPTLSEPRHYDHPFELGPGPSQMMTPRQLVSELGRFLPLVAPAPKTLDPDSLQISLNANRRVLTILNELIKLLPPGAEAIPGVDDEKARRRWLDAELARQRTLHTAHGPEHEPARGPASGMDPSHEPLSRIEPITLARRRETPTMDELAHLGDVLDSAGGMSRKRMLATAGALRWSPDGRTIARVADHHVVLCDREALADERYLFCGDPVIDLAFSPDGTLLATASGYTEEGAGTRHEPRGEINVWRVRDGFALRRHQLAEEPREIAFAPDGRAIVFALFASASPEVWWLDGAGGALDAVQILAAAPRPKGPEYPSPDGIRVARLAFIADRNQGLHILTVKGRQGETCAPVPMGAVEHVFYAPDGSALLIGGARASEVWSLGPPRRLARYDVLALGFGPEGRTLGWYRRDQDSVVVAPESRRQLIARVMRCPPALAVDGTAIAVAEHDSLSVWSTQTAACLGRVSGGFDRIAAVAPGGRSVVVGDLRSLDWLAPGETRCGNPLWPEAIGVAAWSRAGSVMAAITRGRVEVRGDDKRLLQLLDVPGDFPTKIALSASGARIAIATVHSGVWVVGIDDASIVATAPTITATALVFAPDGRQLACGDDDGRVSILQVS